jgi:hypothetical protein
VLSFSIKASPTTIPTTKASRRKNTAMVASGSWASRHGSVSKLPNPSPVKRGTRPRPRNGR